MKSVASSDDLCFRRDFEALRFPPQKFKHAAHLKLAYVYLCEHDIDAAHQCMRGAILSFLSHLGIDASKYHETVTRAWILAVRHFMEKTPGTQSFEALVTQHPVMLDSKIMLTHYSAEVLFSPEARGAFVEPNLDPIPRYDRKTAQAKR